MKNTVETISNYFPERLKAEILKILKIPNIEEIRIRVNRPIQLITHGGEQLFNKLIITEGDCKYLFEAFCEHSVYAFSEDIKNGFITLSEYGIRVGISGNVLFENGRVVRFKEVTGFCIRLPCEHLYCSSELCFETDGLKNSSILIISPPGIGKTTLLRDMARELSDRYKRKICIIDERSELAGCFLGVPKFNVGIRTDVIDNCNKKDGMLIAIRSLSPDVLISDELGSEEDAFASQRAINSGISLAVSVHAKDIEQLKNNKAANQLFNNIRYVAELSKSNYSRKIILYDKLKNSQKEIKLNGG